MSKLLQSEQVWLEAARLQPPDIAKSVCAAAIREIPTSVELWCKAADLEQDNTSKKRVYRKGLFEVFVKNFIFSRFFIFKKFKFLVLSINCFKSY